MKSILIIGGGFIAKSLAERFCICADVAVITRRVHIVAQVVRGARVYPSLADFRRVGGRPDWIVFCTGPSSTGISVESAGKFNSELRGALRYAEEVGVDTFIYISSGGAIYAPSRLSLTELSPLDLEGSYARFHLDCEGLLRSSSGIRNRLCFRLGNPFGKYQNPTRSVGFVSMAMRSALFNSRLSIIGNGLIYRDFFHISLFTNFLASEKFADCLGFEVFNFGSGVSISLLDVVHRISNLVARDIEIIWRSDLSSIRPSVHLDVSKLEEFFGFTPKHDFEAAIRLFSDEWAFMTEGEVDQF